MNRKNAYIPAMMMAGAMLFIPLCAHAADDNDKKFLTNAAQSDVNEIQLSQLAAQKATNPDVKAFAQKMVTEHKDMSSSMQPFGSSWGLTPPAGPDADVRRRFYTRVGSIDSCLDPPPVP